MLGVLLLFFIGRYFYNLAHKYQKNGWLYGFVGIVTYYAGGFAIVLFYVIVVEFFQWNIYGSDNEIYMSLLALPFGILSCYLLYHQLERQFQGKNHSPKANTLDEELFE